MKQSCISCATVSGSILPTGGVVCETATWIVVLRANPVRFPCLPLIILKQHREQIADLSYEESSCLGPLMTLTAQVLNDVLQPAKVHFGLYAESVKHIHVHVFPRMPNMPAGNIPNLWMEVWMKVLHSVGLKKAYSNEVVTRYAEKLSKAYLEVANFQPEQA